MWFSKTQVSQEPQLVLILQSGQAWWLRLSEGKIVGQFNEVIREDPAPLQTKCPWVHNKGEEPIEEPIYVTLILDTTMDEVDRVSVAQTGSVVINKYRQLTTIARLRADYPMAHAYALPYGYYDQIAALMHPDISEQWSAWLLFIQSKNVLFSKVATASELAADWSRGLFFGPTLLVMQVAGFERHLMVDRGSILFLRTAHVNTTTSVDSASPCTLSNAAVLQSIGHLSSVIPDSVRPDKDSGIRVVSELRVLTVDASPSVLASSGDKLIDQNALESCNQDFGIPDSVKVLSALFAEQTIEYSESVLCDRDVSCTHQLIAEPVKTSGDGVNSGGFFRILITFKTIYYAFLRKRRRRWSLSRPGVRQMYALLPSLKHEKICGRIRVMFGLSVFMAGLAVVGVTAALANGIISARYMGQLQQQRASVERAVAGAYDNALASHSQPRLVAESLIIADLLAHNTMGTPEDILSGVATAVNAVPGVSIDRIVWAVVEADDTYESLTHALAAVPSIRTVESRAGVWTVQVEIAGRVSGDTLVIRKTLLDTLLVELRALSGAMDVVVLESPVDLALSSATDSRRADQYRLTLKLGER